MDNGALHVYLKRTTLTMERKLQLVRSIVYQITLNECLYPAKTGGGWPTLSYEIAVPRKKEKILTTFLVHQKGIVHGDLTSVGIL